MKSNNQHFFGIKIDESVISEIKDMTQKFGISQSAFARKAMIAVGIYLTERDKAYKKSPDAYPDFDEIWRKVDTKGYYHG